MRKVSVVALVATSIIFGALFVLFVGLEWFVRFIVSAVPSSAEQFQPALRNFAMTHASTSRIYASTWVAAFILTLLVLFVLVGCAYWLRARLRPAR